MADPPALVDAARTLLDLADILDDRALARAVNEAYVLRLTTPTRLAAMLERSPGRRTARLAPHTAAARPTRSTLEDDVLHFAKRHGLPAPQVNQWIAGYEVDVVWREQRLVVELDGFDVHATRRAFERDRERDADLLGAGFSTVRVTQRRLAEQPRREAGGSKPCSAG